MLPDSTVINPSLGPKSVPVLVEVTKYTPDLNFEKKITSLASQLGSAGLGFIPDLPQASGDASSHSQDKNKER